MIHCPQCNRKQPFSVLTCDCGFDLQSYRQKLEERERASNEARRPYELLPTLRVALNLLAFLSALGGIVGAFVLVIGQEQSIWAGLAAVLSGLALAVPYLAGAEAIKVLLDIKEQQQKIQRQIQ